MLITFYSEPIHAYSADVCWEYLFSQSEVLVSKTCKKDIPDLVDNNLVSALII